MINVLVYRKSVSHDHATSPENELTGIMPDFCVLCQEGIELCLVLCRKFRNLSFELPAFGREVFAFLLPDITLFRLAEVSGSRGERFAREGTNAMKRQAKTDWDFKSAILACARDSISSVISFWRASFSCALRI